MSNRGKKGNGQRPIDKLFTRKRLKREGFNPYLAPRICAALGREGIRTVAELKAIVTAEDGHLQLAYIDGLRGKSLAAIEHLLGLEQTRTIPSNLPRLPR